MESNAYDWHSWRCQPGACRELHAIREPQRGKMSTQSVLIAHEHARDSPASSP